MRPRAACNAPTLRVRCSTGIEGPKYLSLCRNKTPKSSLSAERGCRSHPSRAAMPRLLPGLPSPGAEEVGSPCLTFPASHLWQHVLAQGMGCFPGSGLSLAAFPGSPGHGTADSKPAPLCGLLKTRRKEPVKGAAAAKFPLVFTFPVSFCPGPSGGFRMQPLPLAALPRWSRQCSKKTPRPRQSAPPWL